MTLEAIESIFTNTHGVKFEVIVVDNASKDGSAEVLSKVNRITTILSPQNLGFGKANNLGVNIAKGRNILFLNTDTKIIDNSIAILSHFLDAHPEVGAVGGNLIDATGNPTQSFERRFPGPIHVINSITHGVLYRIMYGRNVTYCHSTHPLEVAYITGADLMVPKRILDAFGAFDPVFFMYYEETDLCFRIRKAGYKIVIVPDAKIIHYEGGTLGGQVKLFNPTRVKMMYRSRRIFIKKNYTTFKGYCINSLFTFFLRLRRIFGYQNAKQMLDIHLQSKNSFDDAE